MSESSQMLAAARLRFKNGDFAGAMDLCRLTLHQHGRIHPVFQLLESMAWESASQGRYDQTATCFELMLSHSPDSADLHFNLAAILLRLGDRPRVIDALRNATRYRPDWIDAFYYLALTLQEVGQFQEAATQWRRVLELNPDHGSALFNLGVVLERLGETDQAQDCYQRARKCVPTTLLCMDLGLKNLEEGRTDQAIEDLTKATAMDPNCAIAWMNLGVALMRDGKISDSLSAFDASLRLEPWRAEAHWNRAPALLIVGNFNEGWQEYEWRSRCPEFSTKIRKVDRPMWRGEEIRGKTILLHDEQGFGDTFQFVRYAPLLAERGAKVILLCKGAVAALLTRVPGVSQVVADGQPCPHVDFHAAMPSLPSLFGTSLETIPANTPYLSADPALVDLWATRLPASQGKARIGIAWAGNAKPNRYRSIPANLLGPLMERDGLVFHSLQKQIEGLSVQPPQGLPIHDFSAQIRDFSDTAALIANMDLVITIDTSVAHLAGAMGKRVWILLPTAADWRWLTDRQDSPWYPTARLFRQQKAGDWPELIARVAKQLVIHAPTTTSGIFANSPAR